ncbi:MAG: FHA domain-containing protein [Chloroflexi bacterium]|nr:FHA domain-containing protein [Chloroflexota bacterium]
MAKTTFHLTQHPLKCAQCGSYAAPHETQCPQCGYPIAPPTPEPAETGPLHREPSVLNGVGTGDDRFPPESSAVLQFLPSAVCISLALDHPHILGRGYYEGVHAFVDLTDLKGLQHGVSRAHCRLQRQSAHLVVVDLGSANGSYLNSEPLLPHREYVVAHGDKLILGTLHLTISFSTRQDAE